MFTFIYSDIKIIIKNLIFYNLILPGIPGTVLYMYIKRKNNYQKIKKKDVLVSHHFTCYNTGTTYTTLPVPHASRINLQFTVQYVVGYPYMTYMWYCTQYRYNVCKIKLYNSVDKKRYSTCTVCNFFRTRVYGIL